MAKKVELGDRVKDRISGCVGIVVGITDWLYLCRSVTVRPEGLNEGKPLGYESFDEPQLEVVKKGVLKATTTPEAVTTGGPSRPSTSTR